MSDQTSMTSTTSTTDAAESAGQTWVAVGQAGTVGSIGRTVDGFVDLLSGDVNWTEVIAALREIGYEGFLTAEVFPQPHAPDLVAEQTSRAIDAMLAL